AGMKTIHVFDMTQPIIDQPELLIRQGGSHTATTVMTTDDNVSHLKYIYCIIEHTEQIHITVDNYIGNVAMNEYFARFGIGDLIRRYSAVGATYPQYWRLLPFRETLEKIGIISECLFYKFFISFK